MHASKAMVDPYFPPAHKGRQPYLLQCDSATRVSIGRICFHSGFEKGTAPKDLLRLARSACFGRVSGEVKIVADVAFYVFQTMVHEQVEDVPELH
jgi:hypothetical protein